MLLAALQVAVGALIAASSQSWALLLCPSAIGATTCAYILSERAQWQNLHWRVCALFLTLILAITPTIGFFYTQSRFPEIAENDLSQFRGRKVHLRGEIEKVLPLKNGKQARFLCRPHSIKSGKWRNGNSSAITSVSAKTLTVLFVQKDLAKNKQLKAGTKFECFCTINSLADLEHRGRGGYAGYLRRMGVSSLSYAHGGNKLVVCDETQKATPSPVQAITSEIEAARGYLIGAHIANLGNRMGSLLTAMVLGEKAVGLDSELTTSFRNVGLSHVLAASGFNLTIVTFSTHWICRAFCFPAAITNSLSFFMLAVFVLFAGNSSSVVRAGLMCALVISCKCLSRRVNIAGILGAALLVTALFDPLSVADPGFQLSYAAVSAIIFVVSPIFEFLKSRVQSRWKLFAAECVLTVMVAQACVLPLQLYYFRQVGLLFLPANVLASIVVTPVTVAGFASSLILLFVHLLPANLFGAGLILWFVGLLDWLAALPLCVLVYAVEYLSSCTWAMLSVPQIEVWHVVSYYFALLLAVYKICGWLQISQYLTSISNHQSKISPYTEEKCLGLAKIEGAD